MKPRVVSIALALWLSASGVNADPSTDQQAYAARCAKCHGETGTGTFMLGRRYGKELGMLERRTDLAPELIRHVVRNGIASMPAITRVEVTDEELDAIVRYLTRKQDTSTPSSKP
jgi:mono/diheme cytochrome c family protein